MAKCVVCGTKTENVIKYDDKKIPICKKCSKLTLETPKDFNEALKKAINYNPKKK